MCRDMEANHILTNQSFVEEVGDYILEQKKID